MATYSMGKGQGGSYDGAFKVPAQPAIFPSPIKWTLPPLPPPILPHHFQLLVYCLAIVTMATWASLTHREREVTSGSGNDRFSFKFWLTCFFPSHHCCHCPGLLVKCLYWFLLLTSISAGSVFSGCLLSLPFLLPGSSSYPLLSAHWLLGHVVSQPSSTK